MATDGTLRPSTMQQPIPSRTHLSPAPPLHSPFRPAPTASLTMARSHSPTTPPPTPAKRRRPRSRFFRWSVRLFIGLPILLFTLLLLVGRSPLVGRIVAAQVRQLTGCDWHAAHASLSIDGRLTITDLSLAIPSIPGRAGEVLSAQEAAADIDWSGAPIIRWFTGIRTGIRVSALRLTRPTFRLSQSLDDGRLNLASISPPAASGSGKSAAPRIDVIDGRIEFAEHSTRAHTFNQLNLIPVTGTFTPVTVAQGAAGPQSIYTMRLQELGRAASAAPGERRAMILDGRFNLDTSESSLKLLNVSLDAWPAESVPSAFRDIWRRLNVQGRISQVAFSSARTDGVRVSVNLESVSMDALVPASKPGDPDGYLSLREVNGQVDLSQAGIKAELTGLIEEQTTPSKVVFTTKGLDLNAALHCEITGTRINLGQNPEFLLYVPRIVKYYLDIFSGPTAIVDAFVVIERGDPVNGQAAPLAVPNGTLSFRNGTAAFHKFPYPIHDLSGEVQFDDTTIRIRKIHGIGPTGAELTAAGVISPLSDDAAVDLSIGVKGAPIDDEILAAMRPRDRRLMEVLFSREKFDRLARSGLLTPDHPFAFGGLADIGIKVLRPLGPDVEWTTSIDVDFDKAGLVPEPFPFPIIASNVRLHINDQQAHFEHGSFQGLRGGHAELSALVRFGTHPSDPVEPDVRITATDIPVDDLLLSAVPGEPPSDSPGPADTNTPFSAKAILRNLDLRGAVDCSINISASADPTASIDFVGPLPLTGIDYGIVVELDKLTASPAARAIISTAPADPASPAPSSPAEPAPTLCLRELSGALELTSRFVRIGSIVAHLGRLPAGITDPAASTPAGQLEVGLEAELAPPGSAPAGATGSLAADIRFTNLDLADPIEPAIHVFSPQAARAVARLRADHQPSGHLSATLALRQPASTPDSPSSMRIGVTLPSQQSVAFATFGGTLNLQNLAGIATIILPPAPPGKPPAPTSVEFQRLAADLAFNAAPSGHLTLSGTYSPVPPSHPDADPSQLHALFTGTPFQSPLLHAAVRSFAGNTAADQYLDLDPRGLFAASVSISPSSTSTPNVSGWVEPEQLALRYHATDIAFTSIDGRATFDVHADGSASGELTANTLALPAASARGRVRWSLPAIAPADPDSPPADSPARPLTLHADFDAQIRALDPAVRALLPQSALDTIDGLALSFSEPISITSAQIRSEPSFTGDVDDPALVYTSLAGQIVFSDLAADVGVPLANARGQILAQVDLGGIQRFELNLNQFTLASVRMSDAHMVLRTHQTEPGTLEILEALANCHTGRVSASGQLHQLTSRRPAIGPPAPDRTAYRLQVAASGVQFAPLLDDLDATPAPSASTSPQPPAPAAPPASRGQLDASLSISGISGDLDSRIGRGAIRIANGDVLKLPLVLPLMQVSNLLLPSSDRLDYLQSTFHIAGPTAVFEEVALLSRSIALVGRGTIDWPDLRLDMRFNSKSTTRIPIWSDLFEALRDELVSTTISGTVASPVVRSEPLTTTRRMLDDLFGSDPRSRPPADPTRAERTARAEQTRLQRAASISE